MRFMACYHGVQHGNARHVPNRPATLHAVTRVSIAGVDLACNIFGLCPGPVLNGAVEAVRASGAPVATLRKWGVNLACNTLPYKIAALRDARTYTEGFSHFVTSMTAPVASGWSESPGGPCTHWKAPPFTAHTHHRPSGSRQRGENSPVRQAGQAEGLDEHSNVFGAGKFRGY
jgi:hypothetical protein